MKSGVRWFWVVALCIATGGVGWWLGRRAPARARSESHRKSAESAGAVLATFDGQSVGVEALQERLTAEGPVARRALKDPKALRAYVDRWLDVLLMAHEAISSGLASTPEQRWARTQTLANLYRRKRFVAPERAKPVTEAELKAFFEAHRDEYGRPASIQIAHVLFKTRAEAETALRHLLRARARDPHAFGALARRRSADPTTRSYGGQLPPMTVEALKGRFGPDVVKAVLALRKPGEIATSIPKDSAGFHLLELVRRLPAQTPDFETTRPVIRARYLADRRKRDYETFRSNLEKGAHLSVHADTLRQISTSIGENH